MKFKSRSVDPVQGDDFLQNVSGHNDVRQQKKFKCCVDFQDLPKPITARKLYPNCKFYPFLKHILSMFHFSWLLGCDIAIDEQTIGFQGKHVDKMIISYKNKGGRFQADDLYNQGYTYAFSS